MKRPTVRRLTMAMVVLTFSYTAAAAELQRPIEVTRQFLQGVVGKDRVMVTNSFDFVWANRDLTAKLDDVGITNPWTQQEITDTLIYYFFRPDQVAFAKKCLADDVTHVVQVNPKKNLALVILTRPAEEGEKPQQLARVGLRDNGSGWHIVYFPDFYPLDHWEILTGVPASP